MDAKTRGLLLLAVLSLVCAYLPWLEVAVFSLRSFFALSVTAVLGATQKHWHSAQSDPQTRADRMEPGALRCLRDGVVVGRIFLMPIGPRGRPWMWGERPQERQRAVHGYEPTREAAMAAFAKSWHQQ
jgi:hypothetical protein